MRSFSIILGLCGCLCAAETFPSPDELKKYVCEVATTKLLEDQAIDRICDLVKAEFPGVEFDPDCHTVLKEGWNYVIQYCPHGRLSLPNPKDIEKYVCEVAEQKMIEDKATDKICELIKEKFPILQFKPDCRTVVEGAWDQVVSHCPKGRVSLPSPQEVEKYVCEVATQKMVEEMATDKVCALIKAKFPSVHFDPDCHTAVEKAWDAVASLCPKGQMTAALPSPGEVEKYVCEVATQKMIEEMATDKVCALIKEKFPSVHFDPDCHTAVEKVWDTAASFCPKGKMTAALPSPEEVEKYVCEVATQKMIEEMATDKVCELIKAEFPSVHFNPDCHTAVEKVWDAVASFCPKGRMTALPSPGEVEKYVCEVATQKMIEEMATDKVCALIKEEFPSVHFNPDCHTAVEKAWDTVASFCPKDRLSMPSPEEVEKYVCEVATQRMVEEMATDKVCELMKEKFPSVHFNPDCHTAVEKSWDRVAKFCSSGGPGHVEAVVCEFLHQEEIEKRATAVGCAAAKDLFPKIPFQPDCETVVKGAWDALAAKCPSPAFANPLPGIMEKLACKVIKRPFFEHKLLEVMCEEIEKEVRIPDKACLAVLQRAWNKATAWCPVQATDTIVV